jgi:hypothetical protein
MKDSKGSNHGTSQGSTGSEASAKANGGLDLDDSTSDYIDATNSTLNVGQSFTLEAWIKRRNTGVAEAVLTKKLDYELINEYSFKLAIDASNALQLYVDNSSGF